MRPNESFIGQPIRSLQTMLRVIAEHDPAHQTVVPDGIYGPQTAAAVAGFQRLHGLPVTGVADQNTWENIVEVYEPALINVSTAHPLNIVLNPNQVIRKGERHPHVDLLQAMLTTLAEVYESIGKPTRSGILDEATMDSLSSFQGLNNLPMTGQLDKKTWKHLALHYPLAVNLLMKAR
jgi:peptidoglycan hydrolase-like protein with peptidoglycan-binding domain